MDGRNLPKHKSGERLSHKTVNAIAEQLGVLPTGQHSMSGRQIRSSRRSPIEETIHFTAKIDIEPFSIFAAVPRTHIRDVPTFNAEAKGWGVWTNGPVACPKDTKGSAFPLDFFRPTLIRLTSDPEKQPASGEVCGISQDLDLTDERGGLLCLGTLPHDDKYAWCVRFLDPIDALAKVASENVEKRDRGNFRIIQEDLDPFFADTGTLVKAFNIHNAGLALGEHVRLTLTLGHGITATKWNGGMWLGRWSTELEDGKTVVIDDTEEEIVAIQPPDGLQHDQRVNVIEYDFDEFRAYPIECGDE